MKQYKSIKSNFDMTEQEKRNLFNNASLVAWNSVKEMVNNGKLICNTTEEMTKAAKPIRDFLIQESSSLTRI